MTDLAQHISKLPDICCLGEAMVELSPEPDGRYRRGFGGDAFNTATYLARCGIATAFMSRVGDDSCSAGLLETLTNEGIDRSGVTGKDGANLGLYLINLDSQGERSFQYWRGESPARYLFEHVAPNSQAMLYLTGITVAIGRRAPDGDDAIIAFLEAVRAKGTLIAFDPNIRPTLWPTLAQARATLERVFPLCHMVFPTVEDDALVYGASSIDICDRRYADFGIPERVLKGPGGHMKATGADGEAELRVELIRPVDTTGAGDAFNAGYLAVRLGGGNLAAALNCGARLARHVVSFPGAISPRSQWPAEGFI